MRLGAPVELPEVGIEEKDKSELEPGYLVICWNDPVNYMEYVTHVFQKVFGWNRKKAEFHMLQVQERAGAGKHGEGRALRSPTPTLHIARNDGAGLVTLLQASKGKLIFRMSE